jgi:ariadne-1
MTCSQCSYEFCWICGHEWVSHEGEKYGCNAYKEEEVPPKEVSEDARLMHYCKRFLEHKRSLEEGNDEKVKAQIATAFRRKLPTKLKAEEVTGTIETFMEERKIGREVLMWSYPHAYLMEEHSIALRLFEFVQQEAEKAMDDFCWLVEVRKSLSAERIMTAGGVLMKTIETLLKHVDGYS